MFILIVSLILNFVTSQEIISSNKSTSMSSRFASDKYDSSLCVDGDFNNFCHTSNQKPSWTVNLQGDYMICSVELYNRVDCCSERIIGAVVELLDKSDKPIHKCKTITKNKEVYKIYCSNKMAYKVRVRHTKDEYLAFREVQVIGQKKEIEIENISLRKPSSQTSEYDVNKYPASNCNDGDLTNFCHTALGGASWTVDLRGSYKIQSIILHNRVDCCGERIIGVKIELLSEKDKSTSVCGKITDHQKVYNFECRYKEAHKIRVTQTTKEYLHFNEIEVFGEKTEKIEKISLRKPSSQTSNYSINKYHSSNCNDGNLNNFCHTRSGGSWTLDLEGSYKIQSIILHNRVDCCGERIKGVRIELLSEKDNSTYICGKITDHKRVYNFECGFQTANKIRVTQTTKEYLHFNEIEVFGVYNG